LTAVDVTAVDVSASVLLPVFLASVDFIFKCYQFTNLFVCFLFNGFVSSDYIASIGRVAS
jgi:hypothetical protein